MILVTLALIHANSLQQENEKLSLSEKQEVREFARRFSASFEQTRDLTPYLNKQPARNLFDKAIAEPKDSTAFIDNDVIAKVGHYQLRRFTIAMFNLGFLSESYVYGRFLLEKTAVRDLSPQPQYPPHVAKLMNRNPTIKRWWKNDSENRVTSVAQFYSVLNTFNKAATAMRAYFKRHPPESTATYKQNVTYRLPLMKEITVDTCNSEQNCAGLSLRTQTIKVNLPVMQLHLVRLDGRLQILFVGLYPD